MFEQVAATTAAVDQPSRGTRGRKAAIAGSVFGIGAAALVGVAFVTGRDSAAGGASSPEAAITEMAEALSAGDALAAVGYLAPDELSGADAFVEQLIPYVAELSDDFERDEPEDRRDDEDLGFELDVEAVDVEAEQRGDHAAIVSFAIVGEITIDGSGLSILDDSFFGLPASDVDSEIEFDSRIPSDDFDGDDLEFITVEIDGKWYISPFLSAGHAWVESDGLPGGDYELVGEERPGAAPDPVSAVERYFQLSSLQSAAETAELLGGGEGRFFHVFNDALDSSELFDGSSMRGLDDAFDADFDYTLTELDDGRVEIDDIELSFDDGFGETVTMTISDGCGTFETYGDRLEGCFSELFPPGSDVDDTIWFQTVEEDGGYRVVVLPTMFDMMSRFIGPYDAETIRWALDLAHEDNPIPARIDEQIAIDFDGRRYAVYEFELEANAVYDVVVDEGTGYDVFTDYGDDTFSKWWGWSDQIEAFDQTTLRVVVHSDVASDCRGFECVPNGEGMTSLTLTETETLDDGWNDELGPEVREETDDWLDDDADEVGVEDAAEFETWDPRVDNQLIWDTVELDGTTSYTLQLPAGVYELWASTWNGDDVGVTIDGAECDPAGPDVSCSLDHGGGAVEVLLEPGPGSSAGSMGISVTATYLPNLTVVDTATVSLDPLPAGGRAVVVFDNVAPGTILVVASGSDGQDLVVHVDGEPQCKDVDNGLSEGEACAVGHDGGPLTVEVGGWAAADQVGEAEITLEVTG